MLMKKCRNQRVPVQLSYAIVSLLEMINKYLIMVAVVCECKMRRAKQEKNDVDVKIRSNFSSILSLIQSLTFNIGHMLHLANDIHFWYLVFAIKKESTCQEHLDERKPEMHGKSMRCHSV